MLSLRSQSRQDEIENALELEILTLPSTPQERRGSLECASLLRDALLSRRSVATLPVPEITRDFTNAPFGEDQPPDLMVKFVRTISRDSPPPRERWACGLWFAAL